MTSPTTRSVTPPAGVPPPAAHALLTAEDLLRLPRGVVRHELIYGKLRTMPPAGDLHGDVADRVGWELGNYVEAHKLGRTRAAETGFKLASDPDLVRAPDAAFVRNERLPQTPGRGYFEGAPDLAVEVVSPSDCPGNVAGKVACWLDHGSREVWVLDPATRTVTVYRRGDRPIRVFGADDLLESGELLPGFAVPVSRFFPPLAETADADAPLIPGAPADAGAGATPE